jgi:hypothetical protein
MLKPRPVVAKPGAKMCPGDARSPNLYRISMNLPYSNRPCRSRGAWRVDRPYHQLSWHLQLVGSVPYTPSELRISPGSPLQEATAKRWALELNLCDNWALQKFLWNPCVDSKAPTDPISSTRVSDFFINEKVAGAGYRVHCSEFLAIELRQQLPAVVRDFFYGLKFVPNNICPVRFSYFLLDSLVQPPYTQHTMLSATAPVGPLRVKSKPSSHFK